MVLNWENKIPLHRSEEVTQETTLNHSTQIAYVGDNFIQDYQTSPEETGQIILDRLVHQDRQVPLGLQEQVVPKVHGPVRQEVLDLLEDQEHQAVQDLLEDQGHLAVQDLLVLLEPLDNQDQVQNHRHQAVWNLEVNSPVQTVVQNT